MHERIVAARPKRAVAALTVLLANAACAQNTGPSQASARTIPTTIRITDNAGAAHGDMTYYFDDNLVVSVVDAAPGDIWAHVLTGYDAFGLAPDVQDPRSLTVGVQERIVRRSLGDHRVSAFLGCGRDMTGDLADRATIRLWMITRLTPSSDGSTEIRTELTANATDNDGTSRTVRPCTSNHRLEMGLVRHVSDALDPSSS